ncbi:MAG: PorT family protein [Bacteroidetes bacterium]|nr:PorT family protein [Fibrella sp.]
MDTVNLRRSVDLHRSKAIVLLMGLWLMTGYQAIAQKDYKYIRKFQERYDDKPIHYGFFFAAPTTHFKITHSDAFQTADSAYRISSPNTMGFRVGFIFNAYMNDRFDFRSNPSVSLYSRTVNFDYPGGLQKSEKRESTWLNVPILFKYKSERRTNSRMYLIAGGSFAIETNVRKNESQGAGRLNTGTADFTLEYGVGFEQFFQFFKFAPELRFSQGIPNLYRTNALNPTSIGIQRLTTNTVTLYLNFE